jgi:secondary thiamine-phosphate synthase enzyme
MNRKQFIIRPLTELSRGRERILCEQQPNHTHPPHFTGAAYNTPIQSLDWRFPSPYEVEARVVRWFQHEVQLPPFSRGIHPITQHILGALSELSQVKIGLLHVFIQHTSASLTINENADPEVLVDLDRVLDVLAPEDFAYRHMEEGNDDMPGHVKSSLMGSSVSVPIRDGRLCLGVWQGICLCEHRRRGGRRRLVLTVQGDVL